MAAGPILIFDKSALQSLSLNEAVWLDNFFLTNITPLFFVETLADLEKAVRGGRPPEAAVGDLALKTPDMESVANIHHVTLLIGELLGTHPVDMEYGRPIITGQAPVHLNRSTGVMVRTPPEADALARWQAGEFMDVERQFAKGWRRSLAQRSLAENCAPYRPLVEARRPRTLSEVRVLSYSFLAIQSPEWLLRFGMSRFGVPEVLHSVVLDRFVSAGRPPLARFAPFLHHLLEVEGFLYTAIASDLIGSARTSNAVDMAYLYYLPFCMVFTSNDALHARVVPLFLKSHQSFVVGSQLKRDLARIEDHYSALPMEIQEQGLLQIAKYPPVADGSVVCDLWDKHCPIWRQQAATPISPPTPEEHAAILEKLDVLKKGAPQTGDPGVSDPDFVFLERKVRPKKGRWMRFRNG